MNSWQVRKQMRRFAPGVLVETAENRMVLVWPHPGPVTDEARDAVGGFLEGTKRFEPHEVGIVLSVLSSEMPFETDVEGDRSFVEACVLLSPSGTVGWVNVSRIKRLDER